MSIILDNVTFAYEEGPPVLHQLSYELTPGECLLVVGHNGAGKSTLLKLLNGILRPLAGRIAIYGRDTQESRTSELARDIAVTFQNPADQLFARTVFDEVRFGPTALGRKDPTSLAQAALTLCELDRLKARHPYDLSLAERKLLTVASAVATGARALAFDEPSVSLSQPERRVLEHVLARLRREGRTLIIVSHDLGLFLPCADRVLVLGRGMVPRVLDASEVPQRFPLLRSVGVRMPYAERILRLARRLSHIHPSNHHHTREP